MAALLALGTAWLAACAPFAPARPHPELSSLWREYTALPDERALAIAGEIRQNRWVAGVAAGRETPAEAEAEALAECRRRRTERRFQDPCLLYAIGDEVVWPRR